MSTKERTEYVVYWVEKEEIYKFILTLLYLKIPHEWFHV